MSNWYNNTQYNFIFREEWKNVYKMVYSSDTYEMTEALYRMTMWKSRYVDFWKLTLQFYTLQHFSYAEFRT